ncbi:hypothetical protein ACKI16_24015 [Streptomyces scabiei]|uniref:hypothetical protein n=1 Tax=Streptomyces scabiei TaxID=1930 RepID=UPI0038F80E2F
MAMDGYLVLGGVELANAARLETYLQTVGSPLDSPGACACFTADMVGDDPYTTPEEDGAPWYDPDVPESADFAGLRVLSVEGLDDYPVRRTVTNAVTGGGALGPARVMPRTITITGVLLGATCCAVEYGLHWLAEAVTGCVGNTCDGDCLTLFSCCPGEETPEDFQVRRRRTLRRVALTQGPTVVQRRGSGCTTGECSRGADLITVEIVLTAATPWLWTDPTPLLDVALPADDSDDCVTWCVHGTGPVTSCLDVSDACPVGSVSAPVVEDDEACDVAWPVADDPVTDPCAGTCRFLPCVDELSRCSDPHCAPPVPPSPATLESCYCLPLAVEREFYELDLSGRPGWSVDVPIITLRAGKDDLRNVTITFYKRPVGGDLLTCEEVAEMERCHPHSQFHVAYVPAGGVVTLDGQIGRSVVQCGATCETSRDVYGPDGAPPTFAPLDCATFCVAVETDIMNPPSPNARLLLSVSGRGY